MLRKTATAIIIMAWMTLAMAGEESQLINTSEQMDATKFCYYKNQAYSAGTRLKMQEEIVICKEEASVRILGQRAKPYNKVWRKYDPNTLGQ